MTRETNPAGVDVLYQIADEQNHDPASIPQDTTVALLETPSDQAPEKSALDQAREQYGDIALAYEPVLNDAGEQVIRDNGKPLYRYNRHTAALLDAADQATSRQDQLNSTEAIVRSWTDLTTEQPTAVPTALQLSAARTVIEHKPEILKTSLNRELFDDERWVVSPERAESYRQAQDVESLDELSGDELVAFKQYVLDVRDADIDHETYTVTPEDAEQHLESYKVYATRRLALSEEIDPSSVATITSTVDSEPVVDAATTTTMPDTPTAKPGRRPIFDRLSFKRRATATTAGALATGAVIQDAPVKQTRRERFDERTREFMSTRRGKIAVAVAALGLAAAALFTGATIQENEQARAEAAAAAEANAEVELPPLEITVPEAVEAIETPPAPEVAPAPPAHALQEQSARTATLVPGGNPWDSAREYLAKVNLPVNNHNAAILKNATLATLGLTEDGARYLPVGFEFPIPLDAIKQVEAESGLTAHF